MKKLTTVFLSALLLVGCTDKTGTNQPSSIASPSTSANEFASVETEWKKVWKSSSPLDELKTFSKKHGLFLETGTKGSGPSYLAEEGPCGDTYVSLVSNAQSMIETVYEIDSTGKTLSSWNTGTGEVLRIEGDRIIRAVKFHEDPKDYSAEAASASRSPSHEYLLSIDSKGNFEVLGKEGSSMKTKFIETKCPELKDVRSDYSYCVQDPGSKRMFVFQRPCT